MIENYYAILEVSPNASQEEIKRAYKQAAIKNHPDRGGEHKRMVQVNEAYAILGDPARRAEYDLVLATSMDDQHEAEWQQKTASARAAASQYPSKWSDFEKWINGFIADVKRAKYGSEDIMPKIDGSKSGIRFCTVGGILGVLLIGIFSGFYPALYRWLIAELGSGFWDMLMKDPWQLVVLYTVASWLAFGPFLGGAWAGFFLHMILNEVMISSRRAEQPPTCAANQESAEPDENHEVLPCPTCGQKLRIPKVQENLTVTCPKCRGKFHRSAVTESTTFSHRIPLLAGLVGLVIGLWLADIFTFRPINKVAEEPPAEVRERVGNDEVARKLWKEVISEGSDTFIKRFRKYPLLYLIGSVAGAVGGYKLFAGYKILQSNPK